LGFSSHCLQSVPRSRGKFEEAAALEGVAAWRVENIMTRSGNKGGGIDEDLFVRIFSREVSAVDSDGDGVHPYFQVGVSECVFVEGIYISGLEREFTACLLTIGVINFHCAVERLLEHVGIKVVFTVKGYMKLYVDAYDGGFFYRCVRDETIARDETIGVAFEWMFFFADG
jgi:hypothetical protein